MNLVITKCWQLRERKRCRKWKHVTGTKNWSNPKFRKLIRCFKISIRWKVEREIAMFNGGPSTWKREPTELRMNKRPWIFSQGLASNAYHKQHFHHLKDKYICVTMDFWVEKLRKCLIINLRSSPSSLFSSKIHFRNRFVNVKLNFISLNVK